METNVSNLKYYPNTSKRNKRTFDNTELSLNDNSENFAPNKSFRSSVKPTGRLKENNLQTFRPMNTDLTQNLMQSTKTPTGVNELTIMHNQSYVSSVGTSHESRSSSGDDINSDCISLGYSSGSSTGNSPLGLPIDSPTSLSNRGLITSQFTFLRRVHSSNSLNRISRDLNPFKPIIRSNSIDGGAANVGFSLNRLDGASSVNMSVGNVSSETDDSVYMSDGDLFSQTTDDFSANMSDRNNMSLETHDPVNMSLEKEASGTEPDYDSDMEDLFQTFNDINLGEGINIEDNSDGRFNNSYQESAYTLNEDGQSNPIRRSQVCKNFQSIATSDDSI